MDFERVAMKTHWQIMKESDVDLLDVWNNFVNKELYREEKLERAMYSLAKLLWSFGGFLAKN